MPESLQTIVSKCHENITIYRTLSANGKNRNTIPNLSAFDIGSGAKLESRQNLRKPLDLEE